MDLGFLGQQVYVWLPLIAFVALYVFVIRPMEKARTNKVSEISEDAVALAKSQLAETRETNARLAEIKALLERNAP